MLYITLPILAIMLNATPSNAYGTEINSSKDPLAVAMEASVAGMMSQSERMKVISQNVANSEVTGSKPGEAPYRRKVIYFKTELKNGAMIPVVDKVGHDMSEFILKYEPGHPAADSQGYVKYPNISKVIENVDAKEAQRSFEANMNSMSVSKSMTYRAIDLIK